MKGSRRHLLASLVLCGILAGVVLAAAAFPAAGFTGLAAKSASDSFSDLPADLELPPAPQASTLYASDGKTEIAEFYDENRRNVCLSQIAPIRREAMIAAEDNRFYEHEGVDLKGNRVPVKLVVTKGGQTNATLYTPEVFEAEYGFAPIRIDIATPVTRRRGEAAFQVYLSIGQSF